VKIARGQMNDGCTRLMEVGAMREGWAEERAVGRSRRVREMENGPKLRGKVTRGYPLR